MATDGKNPPVQVHRIPLENTVFEGENNAYLLAGEEVVLVDAGVATPGTRRQLERGLAAHDVAIPDVDRVFLTHWHQGHSGLAGAIQREAGATIHVHPADAPLVTADPAARAALHERHLACFDEWGMPPEKRAELLGVLDGSDLQEPVAEVELIEHALFGESLGMKEVAGIGFAVLAVALFST